MANRTAWKLLGWGAWSALASTAGLAWAQGAAQPAAPAASAGSGGFDAYRVMKQPCDEQALSLQAGMTAGQVDAYLLAATLFELGGCLKQNDARANELLQQAARMGSQVAERRLGTKFAFGVGVPQSYATAGAWFNGKAFGKDALTKEDYSTGYACGIAERAMQLVVMPAEAYWNLAAADLSIVVPALDVRKTEVTVTSKRSRVVVVGSRIARNYAEDYQNEYLARVDEAQKQAKPPDPALLVDAQCRRALSFNIVDEPSDVELARRRALGGP